MIKSTEGPLPQQQLEKYSHIEVPVARSSGQSTRLAALALDLLSAPASEVCMDRILSICTADSRKMKATE